MNQLQVFNNNEFGNVEIVEIDGKAWFGASSVAEALGYSNPRDAIARHCKGDGVVKHDGVSSTTNQHGVTSEQAVTMNFINEGNLYRLIVKSKLPSAERFERWVFDEVLPTIRKTGRYEVAEKQPSYTIDDRILRAERWIEEERERIALTEQVAIAAPKVEAFDTFLTAENVLSMNEAAKSLGIGRNTLFGFLRDQKVLMANNLPYQSEIKLGRFRVKQTPTQRGNRAFTNSQTMVTAKGVEYIRHLLAEDRKPREVRRIPKEVA